MGWFGGDGMRRGRRFAGMVNLPEDVRMGELMGERSPDVLIRSHGDAPLNKARR